MSSVFPPRCAERFRHVAELARGGYGTVHRAVQVALDRPVVVKLLHASVQEPEALARFAAEARVTAALADPHIVVVIDHDVADAAPWIAYEELPGPDVRAILDAGAPPLAEATRIASQVASALAAAHAQGVLHRDIKPENVLAASPGIYKVTDFGIAKWSGAGVATADGTILGTPAYLSPEVCEGKDARPASDVYALGVMLHELLSGVRPFPHEDVMELLTAHAREAPPRISGLASSLDDLLARMLAKAPLSRPPLDEVRAVLAPFHGETAAPARARGRSSGRVQVTRAGSRPVPAVVTRPSTKVPAAPRRGPAAALALAATLAAAGAAAVALRPAPKPIPTPAPVATVSAPPSAPALIALESVKHLVARPPGAHVLAEWERTGDVWQLAAHAVEFDHNLVRAERIRGRRKPEEGGATGDVLVERTVVDELLRYRRMLQDQSDGKIDMARVLPEALARLARYEGQPDYARSARLQSLLVMAANERQDRAAAVQHGLRALMLAPVAGSRYVRQALVTPDLLHDVGNAARVDNFGLTPEASLHFLRRANEAKPDNPVYAADFARELLATDFREAERVIERAGDSPAAWFWTHEARFQVALANGRVGRARRALEVMAAGVKHERETTRFTYSQDRLAKELPETVRRLAPSDLLEELEGDWDWVSQQPALVTELTRLSATRPALEATLVARGLAAVRPERAFELELAAEAAGALRVVGFFARRRGDDGSPGALARMASREIAPLALRLEQARREPPDDLTRALVAHVVAFAPVECARLVERLLAAGAPDATLHAQAARVRRYQGRLDDAVQHATAALKLAPDHVPAATELAAVLTGQGRLDEVLAMTRGLRTRPDLSIDMVSHIAEAEISVGVPAEAVALLDPAIARFRSEAASWVLQLRRADALVKMGQLDEAQAALEALSKSTQGEAATLDALARLAAKRGRDADADRYFVKALKGDDYWIHQNYATFLKSRNRSKEAAAHQKRASELIEKTRR